MEQLSDSFASRLLAVSCCFSVLSGIAIDTLFASLSLFLSRALFLGGYESDWFGRKKELHCAVSMFTYVFVVVVVVV